MPLIFTCSNSIFSSICGLYGYPPLNVVKWSLLCVDLLKFCQVLDFLLEFIIPLCCIVTFRIHATSYFIPSILFLHPINSNKTYSIFFGTPTAFAASFLRSWYAISAVLCDWQTDHALMGVRGGERGGRREGRGERGRGEGEWKRRRVEGEGKREIGKGITVIYILHACHMHVHSPACTHVNSKSSLLSSSLSSSSLRFWAVASCSASADWNSCLPCSNLAIRLSTLATTAPAWNISA